MTTYTLGRIGLQIRGNYDAEAEYDELDVVYFGSNSYVAKEACEGIAPDENTEGNPWQLLAKGSPVNSISYAAELPAEGTLGQIIFVPSEGASS